MGFGFRSASLLILYAAHTAAANSLCSRVPAICDGTWSGTSLSIAGQGLDGTLPTELFQYTNVTSINLGSPTGDINQVSGTLPTHIGLLTDLTSLILYRNRFSGTLPTEIGLLTRLANLQLYTNQLSGTLPTEIGRLTQLTASLYLFGNSFSGTLPTELNLLSMSYCSLTSTQNDGSANTNAFSCPFPTLPASCAAPPS